jgi:hypothetical protein
MPAAPLTFSVIASLLPIPDWALSQWDDKSLARMIGGCTQRGADRTQLACASAALNQGMILWLAQAAKGC